MHRDLLLLLQQLEAALKAAGLWSLTAPSADALASRQPFACDTLTFAQWLQFIFIPRLTALVEEQGELPRQSNVAAMAEMVWREDGFLVEVFRLLRQVDGLMLDQ